MRETLFWMCREVLFVGTNLAMLVIFMSRIFEKRRSVKVLIGFLISKLLLVNVLFHVLLSHLFPECVEVKGACLMAASFIGLFAYLFLWYTYKAQLIVIIISGIICEILATSMGNLFCLFLNWISGRKILLLDGEFHIIDLLIPILAALTIPISCKVFEPIFARLRRWKVKQKTPFIAGIIIYFLIGIYSNLGGLGQSAFFSWFCIIAVAILLFFWYVQFFYRKVRGEKEYLEKQQKLSKLRYSAITLQIEKMEAAQKVISSQMQRIMEIPEDAAGRTHQLENYMKGLKKQREAIVQGVFCDSWLLDSVLCHQMIKCKNRNITWDFRLWGYKKGRVPEENLAELVHYLLEIFLSDGNTKEISLHMASIKGQLVIRAGCVREDSRFYEKKKEEPLKKAYGRCCISNRRIRRYMRGHQTAISKKKEGCQRESTIIIG